MNRFSWLTVLIICLTGCTNSTSDIFISDPDTLIRKKKILILGNSITSHVPAPQIGWHGNWGMAASVVDSDYVHLLETKIERSSVLRFKTIVDFEQDCTHFQFTSLDSLKNPDLLIMRIGENVKDFPEGDTTFITAYKRLIHYVAPNKKTAIVLTSSVWPNCPVLTKQIREYAKESSHAFINLTPLYQDSTNMASSHSNKDVRIHPNNKGMRYIADRIWEHISIYFKAKPTKL